jgi:hypothetical protein
MWPWGTRDRSILPLWRTRAGLVALRHPGTILSGPGCPRARNGLARFGGVWLPEVARGHAGWGVWVGDQAQVGAAGKQWVGREDPDRVAERARLAKFYRTGEPGVRCLRRVVGGEGHIGRIDELVVLAKAAVNHLNADVVWGQAAE